MKASDPGGELMQALLHQLAAMLNPQCHFDLANSFMARYVAGALDIEADEALWTAERENEYRRLMWEIGVLMMAGKDG